MNRIEIPLARDILTQTGDLMLRGWVRLHVKNAAGVWKLEKFRWDTGSDISAMPAWYAKNRGFDIPPTGVLIPINTATGQEIVLVRSGTLRVRVDGLSPKEHIIPCHFRDDPDTLPAPGSHAALHPRVLLGLAGVVDKLRIYPDGSLTSLLAPFGMLVVEEL